jgi:hypothetical protein
VRPHTCLATRRGAATIIHHDKETPVRIGFYGDFTQRPMIGVELTRTICGRAFTSGRTQRGRVLARIRRLTGYCGGDLGPWLRKRTNRLMFCAAAARRTAREQTLISAGANDEADLIFKFREQCFHLLSLSLCIGEGGGVDEVASALPRGLMRDTLTVSWCFALFARTDRNVCASRCGHGYGSEHCVRRS